MPTTNATTALKAVTLDHPATTFPTTEWVTLTPELASEWLGKNTANRNQRRAKIASYSRDMSTGEWLVTGESIKFDWTGKMIDGQHRCEAVISSGQSIGTLVVRGLDPRVKQVLDTNAKRSAADALGFAGVKVQAKDIASAARVAVAYETGKIKTGVDLIRLDMTNSEIIAWHEANPDIEQAVALASKVTRTLGSTVAGMAYAILALERIDGLAAVEFFTSAAEYRTDGKGDPRKAMLDAFLSIRSHGRVPTPAETLLIVFRAWNAWRENRQLQLIRSGTGNPQSGGNARVGIPEPK